MMCYCMGTMKEPFKRDCYFYSEERTMEGLMHDCSLQNKIEKASWYIGKCPKDCPGYISNKEIFQKIYEDKVKSIPEGYDFNAEEYDDDSNDDPVLKALKTEATKTQKEICDLRSQRFNEIQP